MHTQTIENELQKTVSEYVTEYPELTRVFEALGIDYCCGGKKPIVELFDKKGLDAETFLKVVPFILHNNKDSGTDPGAMTLDALIDNIVQTHHAYLRQELPRINRLAEKVAKVHGAQEVRLNTLLEVIHQFTAEIYAHATKEEQILFPAINAMLHSEHSPRFPFGTLANPIRAMEMEHDNAGGGLEEMRTLTDNFTPPEWACNTYRALFDALNTLEKDMHLHIHKENNILFPRALELEAQLSNN